MSLLVLATILLWSCNTAYEIIHAINCGGTVDVVTDNVTYVADKFFEGQSQAAHKGYIPKNIKDAAERMLVKNERTSKVGFSYVLPIKEEGKFGVMARFYQYQRMQKGSRVFEVRLGNDLIWTIDIMQEVGMKKPLTKVAQFQIRNGIVYLQGVPALNAFNFMQKTLDIRFQKVAGNPKVQLVMLVRGDLDKFRGQYIRVQNKMETPIVEYLCERIQDAVHVVEYRDEVSLEEVDDWYYLWKILSVRGILSLLLFVIIKFKDWVFVEIERRAAQLHKRYQKIDIKIKIK